MLLCCADSEHRSCRRAEQNEYCPKPFLLVRETAGLTKFQVTLDIEPARDVHAGAPQPGNADRYCSQTGGARESLTHLQRPAATIVDTGLLRAQQ